MQWMRGLLETTSARAPVFHCFGLHEWAMLYRPASASEDRGGVDARSVHQALPLRVSQEEVRTRERAASLWVRRPLRGFMYNAIFCCCFTALGMCTSYVRMVYP